MDRILTAGYTVQTGDGLAQIAQGLKNAINADSILTKAGIFAYATGTSIELGVIDGTATTYSYTVSLGGTETII